MRWITASVLIVLYASALADEPAPQSESDVNTAIDRGLTFLVNDALAWKKEHNCVSCHHASLVVWAMREARQHGCRVAEPVLSDLTKWLAESGEGKTGVPRPEGIPRALNTAAVFHVLALGADRAPDAVSQVGLAKMLKTIEGDQIENGSWAAWPDTRPPFFGPSNDVITSLATLALVQAASGGDEAVQAARDRGVEWLTKTKTDDDPQSVAIRLVIFRRLGRPPDDWEPLAKRIRARQRDDGGWSQSSDMQSDGWATGQALYALSFTPIKPDDPAIARAQAFLIKSQREDGSWPMTSRPIRPGDQGATSLIPITGGGSSWAVLGLVRTR